MGEGVVDHTIFQKKKILGASLIVVGPEILREKILGRIRKILKNTWNLAKYSENLEKYW